MERDGIPLSAVAAALNGEPVGIASITASELLVGVHRANTAARRHRRLEFIEDILGSVPVVSFELDMAREHARISVELSEVGQSIGSHDLIIAATALVIGYGVLTHNVRRFDRVPRLEVTRPNW
jgi:predicted nucleic acid-binding protein